MALRLSAAAALVGGAAAIDNGLGLSPPMGWRSWNCYHNDVDQDKLQSVMAKVASRGRAVDGKNASLADVGYVDVGLDDNWQACGTGVNGSFHDADGKPLINLTKFPSMKMMTDLAHSLGLTAGWYMNNCDCAESMFKTPESIEKHMKGSAAAVAAYGFDGVKLDGCGQFMNLTWWAELLNATGRPIMIENCHWGKTIPGDTTGDAPCTGITTPSNCPYNFFRTSFDIQANWESMFANLQTTTKYQGDPPLARPGTWAYPDMLEVGNWVASYEEERSHFGAWVITSSPLILGFDVNNDTTTDRIWDIITNKEAIAINQAWAGHPGRLVKTMPGAGGQPQMQLWAKPVGGGRTAVFVLSNDASESHAVPVAFEDLGLGGRMHVRCVWGRRDLGAFSGAFHTDHVGPHDSRLYVLSPAEATGPDSDVLAYV